MLRKATLIIMFALLMVGILGCSNNADTVSFGDFIDGKVDDGEKVSVTGKVAFFDEANKNATHLDLEGPTQIIALVDENSKGLKVYNELDVTEVELEKDDEVIIKGIFRDTGKKPTNVIQATEINEK